MGRQRDGILHLWRCEGHRQLVGTDRVKVTLATNVIPGWNEIDAVQLVGKDQ